MADWRNDLIRGLGGKPSPAALAFLGGWQRKEGGATNNNATYNWLNRTDRGYPTINKVGVAAYPNYQTGISRTVDLIRSGYPAIYQALQSGQVSYQNPALQGDLNRWVSGNRTPGMTPYVQSVASLAGANVGAAAGSGSGGPVPSAPTVSQSPATLGSVLPMIAALSARRSARAQGQRSSILPLIGSILGMRQMTASPTAGPQVMPSPTANNPPVGNSSPGGGASLHELFYDPIGAYDEGKWINPIGGHSDHVHFSFGTPQAAMETIRRAQAMGLRASENPWAEGSPPEAGVHTPTSYHYRYFPGTYQGGRSPRLGEGLDVSGNPKLMAALFNWARDRYLR